MDADLRAKAIRVRKSELPLLIVVEGDGEDRTVQMLQAAGRYKLGACIVAVNPLLKELVDRVLRTEENLET